MGLPVGSSARVEDGQKKGGARQRLEPAEAQFQFQFAVPSPSSWSGLVSMDGWQAGKDWQGPVRAGRLAQQVGRYGPARAEGGERMEGQGDRGEGGSSWDTLPACKPCSL